jgi:hypothetical protein
MDPTCGMAPAGGTDYPEDGGRWARRSTRLGRLDRNLLVGGAAARINVEAAFEIGAAGDRHTIAVATDDPGTGSDAPVGEGADSLGR